VDGYPEDLRDAAHVPGNPEHDWGFKARGGASSPARRADREGGLRKQARSSRSPRSRDSDRPDDLTAVCTSAAREPKDRRRKRRPASQKARNNTGDRG
jgi:hypothetical protein